MISIAVDIGGTFTDVVATDSQSGAYFTAKIPSTPSRLVEAVGAGTLDVIAQAGGEPGQVDRFIHGTTVGTNAVLEQKGAVTAVLATEGFEDILEIGRLKRSRMYDVFIDAETPVALAPRRLRRGVCERVGPDGSIVIPLDESQALDAIRELAGKGVEAYAVSFLFSFRAPEHEQRLRELIEQVDPDAGVSLSSEVDPMFREYERTVVTLFDAYVRPVIERYVGELADELASAGVVAPVQIMQSRGGITSAEMVARRPVSVLLSGPAAGVIGARHVARTAGIDNLIAIDVGGTSADISLVAAGKPLLSTEGRIGRYPLRVPMVDVNTIGAGGGSIAWVDASGSFRVGPQSAGSEPGPACYGRGGKDPTVTDASIVLGYLNPAYFAGGTMSIDVDAAHAAVGRLADRLGLTTVEAAAGIHSVLNAKMADEIRLVSVRRGYDPRMFALVLLGGAGAVHGGRLAAELSIPTLLVPPVPGVLSALGLLVADVEHDLAETVTARAGEADFKALEQTYQSLQARVAELMRADLVPEGEELTQRFADMRYVGQGYTLEVPAPAEIDESAIARMADAFHSAHERVYAYSLPHGEVEFLNLRVVQSWGLPRPALERLPSRSPRSTPSRREAYFEEAGGYVDTPVYDRGALAVGDELVGPAIVEQPDTTFVIYPGQTATLDSSSNLVATVPASADSPATEAVAS